MPKLKLKRQLIRLLYFLPLFFVYLFFPQSTPVAADPLVTQGYNTSQSLPIGSMVSILKGTNNSVVAANIANSNSLVGVVISSNNAQVSLSTGSNQVQVATNGVSQVLVSNINGSIKPGDEITASPINGVGMAVSQNAEIIGTAQASFPNQTASTETVTNAGGSKQKIEIGNIPVLISIGYYTKQPTKTLIPTALQNIVNAVAGKQVKTLPIILSVVIFIITLIVVVAIIYSLIHGSIISVGRNPMAQSAVYRNVLQLSALVVGVIAVAMFAIFMILTRLD
jgi:hypothetical protein